MLAGLIVALPVAALLACAAVLEAVADRRLSRSAAPRHARAGGREHTPLDGGPGPVVEHVDDSRR